MIKKCAAIVLFLSFTACGGDSGTDPDPSDLPGSMSAVIDGQSWSATVTVTANFQGGVLGFAGSDANRTIGMALIPDAGPGTYSVGAGSPTNATYTEGGATQWSASSGQGSGSIVLATLTDSGATGTFSFTMPADAITNATGTRTITQGRFNVTF